MSHGLSILIPCYNGRCESLVRALSAQAEEASSPFAYEIIVADDGSTDKACIETNKAINALPHCIYIIRSANSGRAAIRNFLAQQAKHDWLLFIDCDMVVRSNDYLQTYINLLNGGISVVYGGYVIRGSAALLGGNLRYRYESKYSGNSNAQQRNLQPYHDFHTSNFLVGRNIMLAHPLDERFRRYGYEDVLWGKTLKHHGIPISHIDNPLSFEKFETNSQFLAKTTEGMQTLADFRNELQGYSAVIAAANKLRRWHLSTAVRCGFCAVRKLLKTNLLSNKPSVLLFNIYKLGLYLDLTKR